MSDKPVGSSSDEIAKTVEPGPEDTTEEQAEQQDFAARNVAISNALPGGTSPAAGAVIASGGDLGMQPETDEEEIGGGRGARLASD